MRITSHLIRTWADEGNIPDLTLAELDYRPQPIFRFS